MQNRIVVLALAVLALFSVGVLADDPTYEPLIIRMPFKHDSGENHNCVQGQATSYTHSGNLKYSIDFDTPNDVDEEILAPASGIAFAHESRGSSSLGIHINIDIGDGTYVTLAHLKESYIPYVDDAPSGVAVRAGQEIGIEGTTGFSEGDHVHICRMEGDPSKDALKFGWSVDGLRIISRDITEEEEEFAERSLDQFTCGLPPSEPLGDDYASNNNSGCSTFFHDLDCWHWAFPYWAVMHAQDIFTGADCPYDDDLTCIFPEQNITRAEICKIAMNAFGVTLDPTPTEPFIDVCPSHSLYRYIATLYEAGVISGRPSCAGPVDACDSASGPVFCPDDSLTNAEALKILIETAIYAGHDIDVVPSCPSKPFADVPTSHSLCRYIYTANNPCYDFVDGELDDEACSDACVLIFRPNSVINRSRIAKIITGILTWVDHGEECIP